MSLPLPETANEAPRPPVVERADRFDTGGVLSVSAQHVMHDIYPAFLGTLLPVLIERLGIPLAAAGALFSLFRLPSILQPFLGYWADRYDARQIVIWAPTVTAIAISALGLAPSYLAMAVLMVIAGFASAAFHPAAGAMVTRVGGSQWGRASAYFMTGGEIARAIGPAFIAAVLVVVALEQIWVLAIPSLVVALFAFRRIAGKNARFPTPPPPAALRAAIRAQRGPLVLISVIVLLRSLAVSGIHVYLPTYMTQLGASLLIAGAALSIYEVGGVAGALTGGSLSDRFGRRRMMLLSQLVAGPVLFGALILASGPVGFALLVVGGFAALLSGPVQLALMQELLPGNRSVAAGLNFFLGFESSVITTLGIGIVADLIGLGPALTASVLLSMLSLPFTFMLPETRGSVTGH